jgi:hypothetical protein
LGWASAGRPRKLKQTVKRLSTVHMQREQWSNLEKKKRRRRKRKRKK